MRVAYADPPYIGCAGLYEGGVEVNHKILIDHLTSFDGWALSCHSPSLKVILPMCPDDVRIASWVKPFCSFKPNVNPAYSWEPVIYKPVRKLGRDHATTKDHVVASITLKKGLTGAKPPAFCLWLFDLLQMTPTDELHDLFPGTGIAGSQWEVWKSRKQLDLFSDAEVPEAPPSV